MPAVRQRLQRPSHEQLAAAPFPSPLSVTQCWPRPLDAVSLWRLPTQGHVPSQPSQLPAQSDGCCRVAPAEIRTRVSRHVRLAAIVPAANLEFSFRGLEMNVEVESMLEVESALEDESKSLSVPAEARAEARCAPSPPRHAQPRPCLRPCGGAPPPPPLSARVPRPPTPRSPPDVARGQPHALPDPPVGSSVAAARLHRHRQYRTRSSKAVCVMKIGTIRTRAHESQWHGSG